ncbi:MAG: PAS domain S-box protein [Candidatus Sulfotelmatobacter sp.]
MTRSHQRKHNGCILVIGDGEASLNLLCTILTEDGYAVHEPPLDLGSQLRFVKDTLPDMVLVDVRKPGTDGYQVCASLRSDPTTRAIPVIFISSIERPMHWAKTAASGAVDYVTAPFDAEEVLWRIETHIRLRCLRENLKSAVSNRGAQPAVPNEDVERAIREIHILTRVTSNKHAEEKMRQAARELKRTEEALRTSERELGFIVNAMPALLVSARPDGYADFFNQRWIDYTGQPAEQLEGWGWANQFHPDDAEGLLKTWRSSLASGEPLEAEARMRRFDGAYRWLLFRTNALRDESGNIVKWYGTNTDINDRKRAEDDLRHSEAHKSAILDSALDCIVTIDHEGCITEFNVAAERTFGHRQDEVIGKRMADVIIPQTLREQHRQGLARYLATGQAMVLGKRVEMTAVRADGSEFPIELAITRASLDGPPSFTGFIRDLTESKLAEEQLRQSDLNLRQMTETIPEMLWSAGPEGKIDYCNARVLDYTGFSAEKILGNGWKDTVHPDDIELAAREWISCVATGAPYRVEVRTFHAADQIYRWCVTTALPLRDRDGHIVKWHGTIVDNHDWKQAQDQLRTTHAALTHMTRVMTMGQLTASIAHEVNQPLSGIITNTSTCLLMLDSDPPNVEVARETVQRALRDGNRASEVIKRLRALFSKKEVTAGSVDLNEATREVIALSLSELQRNQVLLRTDFDSDLPIIIGDRVQLQQVILNLLRNASDAMSAVQDRPKHLLIRTEREECDRVRLTVQDVGVGFDSDAMDKLFQAFYTTKNEGMGMGLSISRSIIESHHGRLWATPNDGPGATFCFSLPCRREVESVASGGAI